MSYQHRGLASGRWNQLSFFEQMANIGSEVERALNWRAKNTQYSQLAFERALELLDLTICGEKKPSRLKELSRLREVLADYFCGDNTYQSSEQNWRGYFYAFNHAAALRRQIPV